ncbi:MAG: cyclic nucleotide-binding domain-containing protein [Nitrospiraceae bacterium]
MMEPLIHIANGLYLVSYLMRDILWLRVFTVTAASCLISYFYFRPNPLMAAIYWNLVFTSLNVYWIWRLLLERRPVALKQDEQRLCQLVFRSLTPREMVKLLDLGRWENAAPGQCFVDQGKPLDRLIVIYSGKARIDVDGKAVAELAEGQFIGEMSFITGEVAPASVTAVEPTRYVAWPKSKLNDFLKKNPDLRAAFQMILGSDLTRLLRESWAHQKRV